MSFIWILVAFVMGYLARQVKLPPLVGYLAAGFILHAMGFEADANLQSLADLGITLMLFTIGLKVNIKELLRPDIWGTTSVSMGLWVILALPLFTLLSSFAASELFDLSMEACALIAFALSFSSTVCVIKILEDNAELKTRHSDLAITVLIIQDLAAVLFLFIATGKTPSIWSIGLVTLVFARPIVRWIYKNTGHGELVPLSGIMLALGGSALFEALDLKGDLGALAVGILLAGQPNTSELYKSLISFKDLFLIGFFLSIGFTALPTLDMWFTALALLALLPIKLLMFFVIVTAFGFRVRTAFLSAILLSNFSEFGLIVANLSMEQGWLSKDWMVVIALTTAMSFFISSVLYRNAHRWFARYKDKLLRFQREQNGAENIACPVGMEVLIVGMGRVGMGAYTEMNKDGTCSVWGIEVEKARAEHLTAEGYRVLSGDGDDIEFWESLDLSSLKLVMLAIPSITEMKNIMQQLKSAGYRGKISAVARYEDEQKQLISLGADVAFNYYSEVGMGFAEESRHLIHSESH